VQTDAGEAERDGRKVGQDPGLHPILCPRPVLCQETTAFFQEAFRVEVSQSIN